MNYSTLFFIVALSTATFGSPSDVGQHSLVRLRRDTITGTDTTTTISTSIFGGSNYVKLVEELIENLRKAALQARDAVTTFNKGVGEEVAKCQARFLEGIEKLRERVDNAVKSVSDKIAASNEGVRACITAHRGETQILLDSAMQQATTCTNERIQEASDMVKEVNAISEAAQEFANTAAAEMRNCTLTGGNFIALGSCLGSVAMKTEMKGAVFLTQSGLSIARLNLFLSTLPAALEMCAGSGLVGAGVGTAKIVMEIGSCSATSIFNNISGNSAAGTIVPF